MATSLGQKDCNKKKAFLSNCEIFIPSKKLQIWVESGKMQHFEGNMCEHSRFPLKKITQEQNASLWLYSCIFMLYPPSL